MEPTPAKMVSQTAVLQGYYPDLLPGGLQVSIQGGNVSDVPAPVKFGRALVQAQGIFFEDYSTDGADFSTVSEDMADLTFQGIARVMGVGSIPATLEVNVDDKNNTFAIRLSKSDGTSLIDLTGVENNPRRMYVSQNFLATPQV